MKRLLAVLLTAVLIISFSSCGSTEKKLPKGATEDEANYPKRVKENFVENDNETRMTYLFTLANYTTEFNTMYKKLGGDYKEFPYKNWINRADEKRSNGKVYNYYYLKSKDVVLTATEEDESGRLINIGCGISVKNFNSSEKIKSRVMTICGVMAASAGGYRASDVNFFSNLFADTISRDDHSFWYDGCIYIYDKETSSDNTETILFRTMPADKSIKNDWNLQDYEEYWFKDK